MDVMAETEETEFSVNDNCKACESVLSTSVVPSVEVSLKTIDGPVTFTPPLCPKKAVLGGRQVPPMSKAASTASGNNFDFGKGALKHSDHCNSHSGVCRCAPSAHMVPEHHGDPKQLCLKKLSLMTQRKIDHSTNLPLCLSSSEYLSNSYKIPPADRIEFRTNTLVDYVVTSLRKFGWCWIDSFLGPNHADKVLEEVDHLYQRQTFQDGQLAKPAGPFAQLVRTDKIRWYDQKSDGESNSPVNVLLSMIDYVVMAASPLLCNRICGRSKGMISCYPGNGAHYITHVDNPDKDGKLITAIYYLNKEWIAAAGGNLRLYPQNATNYVDVYPVFDRICFFWSDRRNPHEVLPVFQKRFAITVWYFDAQEKAEAVRRELHKQNCETRKRLISTCPTSVVNTQRCSHGNHQSDGILNEPQFDVHPIKPLSMGTYKDLCDHRELGRKSSGLKIPRTEPLRHENLISNPSSHPIEIDISDETFLRPQSVQNDKFPVGTNNSERPSVIQLRKEKSDLSRASSPDGKSIQID